MHHLRGLRWYMIGLVTVGTILGYLTRNSVSVVAVALMEEGSGFELTKQQYSYVVAAYSFCYTIMQPVAGYILDLLGTRIGYALFAGTWAICCMFSAGATGWVGLAASRAAVGASEAAMIPAGLKAASEWFPAKERSVAVGWFNLGSSIGAMIAPPLVAWAIYFHSWELAFILCGVLSLIWAIAWFFIYRHPTEQKYLSIEEKDYIISGQESVHATDNAEKLSMLEIVSTRRFWGIALPRFLAEPAWGTFNAWIPIFMMAAYQFDLKSIAMFAWLPMLFADAGCILGGYMSPFFQKHFKVDLVTSRKLVVTVGGLLMIGPGLIGLFASPYAAIALLCVGGFAHQTLSGALITLSSDVFGRNEVATANGFTGMAAWSASTIFALIVGILADKVGFSPLFVILSVLDILAVVAVWTILVTPKQQPQSA